MRSRAKYSSSFVLLPGTSHILVLYYKVRKTRDGEEGEMVYPLHQSRPVLLHRVDEELLAI